MNATAKTIETTSTLSRRHALFGWWSLLGFLSLGIVLEVFHGLKIGWYLEPAYSTRRLMWTLCHAHGTLLAIVHGLLAVTIVCIPGQLRGVSRWASPCLIAASILLPGGFFLGGIYIYGGDPGIGIFLVPLGAGVLLLAILLIAIEVTRNWPEATTNSTPDELHRSPRSRRK